MAALRDLVKVSNKLLLTEIKKLCAALRIVHIALCDHLGEGSSERNCRW